MLEDRNLFLLAYFMKIVHVELANKRREFFVFEVLGKNLVLEKILVLDNEASSSFSPLNYMAIFAVLQYFIGFHNKVGYLLPSMDSLFAAYILRPVGLLRMLRLAFLSFELNTVI